VADKVYRLRLSQRSANSSMGDWRYYEDEDAFLADLLTAAIEHAVERSREKKHHAWRRWLDLHSRIYDNDNFHAEVIGADVLVDNQWQPVKWLLHPPSIEVLP